MPAKVDDVLDYLRDSKERLLREYGVLRIGVFGSTVRNEASESSDLDVLVDMEDPTFDHYMELKFELEDRFEVSVDLVLRETPKARIGPSIQEETVYA